MRNYELVLVLESGVTDSERKKLLDTIKKWLSDSSVKGVSEWGKKTLVRPIKKHQEAVFSILDITTETLPTDLDKKVAIEPKVLRHLLVRKPDTVKEKPKAKKSSKARNS